MYNTEEIALSQKIDRVQCKALKICPRVPTPQTFTTNRLLTTAVILTTANILKKEFQTLRACRATQPKGGSVSVTTSTKLNLRAIDASASYSGQVYPPTAYPTALNPVEAVWTF